MAGRPRAHCVLTLFAFACLLLAGLLGCAAAEQHPPPPAAPATIAVVSPVAAAPNPPAPPATATGAPRVERIFPVMLGIDTLEADGFAAIKGKRVGLLTHAAGVNRRGVPTVEVLRRASVVKLVALFGVEHGIHGKIPASQNYQDHVDPVTGLPVLSLYNGKSRKPTPQQLKGIEALVVDLQDIGTRSYTFVSAMKLAMEACFENGVELVVLDRPNPLGGLKVDGPPMDSQWTSYVGAFRVPYVHGLTIGELARMAATAPGVLAIPDEVRAKGKLTIVPMRGWRRSMRWPETGLTFAPTSPYIQDFAAAVGYPMVGLGTYLGGFRHGVGEQYPFRGISHLKLKIDVIEPELRALKLPGIDFRRVTVTTRDGKPKTGLYIEVTDWDAWRPTELSFHLMRLACKLEPQNPFAAAPQGEANGFLRHMGSQTFFEALKRDGARTDVEKFLNDWRERAQVYQKLSRRYWLYN